MDAALSNLLLVFWFLSVDPMMSFVAFSSSVQIQSGFRNLEHFHSEGIYLVKMKSISSKTAFFLGKRMKRGDGITQSSIKKIIFLPGYFTVLSGFLELIDNCNTH